MTDRLAMQDPRKQYPTPPFPKQPQPAPGIAGKMNPNPDHGETSYVGAGKLKGRKALITGGDSGIGRAAAIAYAREGADVAIAYLPEERSDADEVIALIEAEGGKALGLPGDVKNEAWCRQLVEQTAEAFGGLDILVVNAAPADPTHSGRSYERGLRRDNEDQPLRSSLDHTGCPASYAGRSGDHHYRLDTGL